MAQLISVVLVLGLAFLAFSPICFCGKTTGGYLYPQFYDRSCPKAREIVNSIVAKAVAKEARMAASLLRLHFHDCFVKGCDASILLDSTGSIISEKGSNPNRNSARGFEVIDKIKSALEKECPKTVSCADIMALSARDSTVLTGGPSWEVPLGRRDSRSASLSGSNNNIPAPNNTFQTILTKFKLQGLNVVDLVALSGKLTRLFPFSEFPQTMNTVLSFEKNCSGSHTIGNARCTSFRQRLYNQSGNGKPDYSLQQSFAAQLRNRCPRSGGDQNLFFLDFVSPKKFDNSYFKNILASKGLLNSDQVLLTKNEASMELVKKYAESNELFFEQFSKSMVKMGNISPLTGSRGEIRKSCRKINS
ncbi:peroxidase 72-like [Populus alba x Populus x berolinensis]|nr:peroxidase 72-like [Populus alba x Populus x berolinensis]